MHPYRNLFEPSSATPAPARTREIPITFGVLAGVSALQVATAGAAHGALAAQTVVGLAFLVTGVVGVARTRRS